MKSTPLLAAIVAAALLLAGCSGAADRDEPDRADGKEIVPLDRAWDVDWLEADERLQDAFDAGDQVVVSTDRRLVGVAPDSGQASWRLPLSSICSISEASPKSGVFAVTWRGKGEGGDIAPCRKLGVVDPTGGAWLWRAKLDAPMDDLQPGTPLAIGDSTVTVITECCYSKALRFDLKTGRALPTIDPATEGFDGWVSTDGTTIATATGLDYEGRNLLRVYDADTGRRLWQRNVREQVEENVAAQVVSSDPLILQTSELGHARLQVFDRQTGRRLTPVGPQSTERSAPDVHVAGVHGDTLVVAFGAAAAVETGALPMRAYDVRSGDERWSGFPAAGGFAGVDPDGRIVVVNNPRLADDTPTTVTRHAVGDVEDFDVLGSLEVDRLDKRFVVGGLLLVSSLDDESGTELTAFDLPEEGQDVDFEVPTEDPVAAQQAAQIEDDRWQEGDLRPGDIESCQPTKQTLRAAGFHQLDLAEQFGCEWFERQEPFGVTRSLDVSYQIATPTESTSAVQEARKLVTQRTSETPFPLGPASSGKYVAVPGLGDDAHVSSIAGPGSHAETHLVVRVANVVVVAEARGEAEIEPGAGASVAGQVVEDSALAAVRDVLATADLDLGPLPERAADGPRSHPEPVCDAMDATVRAVIPDGARHDQRPTPDPGRRVAGCYWGNGRNSFIIEDGARRYFAYAKITAYAVPGSRFGRTGLQQAKAGFATLRRGNPIHYRHGQPLDGIGDEARLFPAEGDGGESKVVVRIDNVLLQVTLDDQANEDHAGQDQQAIELARQAAADYS